MVRVPGASWERRRGGRHLGRPGLVGAAGRAGGRPGGGVRRALRSEGALARAGEGESRLSLRSWLPCVPVNLVNSEQPWEQWVSYCSPRL